MNESLVIHPSHYLDEKCPYECWDVASDILRHKKYSCDIGALVFNGIKYGWRMGSKKGDYGKNQNQKNIEDLQKVIQYSNKVILNNSSFNYKNSNDSPIYRYDFETVMQSLMSTKDYSNDIKFYVKSILSNLWFAGDKLYDLNICMSDVIYYSECAIKEFQKQ